MTTADAVSPAGFGRRQRFADRPIRVKLALLVLVPVTAVLCLSGVIAYGAQSAASDTEQARLLVALGRTAGQLTAQLQQERAAAALLLMTSATEAAVDAFQQQTARTNAVAERFSIGMGGVEATPGLKPVLQRVSEQVDGLPLLREQVRGSQDATASVIVFRYRSVIADLIAYRAAMSQVGVDTDTADSLRASATLSQAIEGLGLVQVGVLPALDAESLTAAEQQQVVANNAAFGQGLEAFRQLAPQRWQAQVSAQAGGAAVVAGERLQALAVSAQPNAPLDLDTTPAGFASALSARMTLLHTVEDDLDAQLVRDVTAQRDRQRRQIAVLGASVLVALIVVAGLAWWMTRSLTRPLRELYRGATDLARTTLPGLVDKLINQKLDDRVVETAVAQAAAALPVHGRDEVGAVAGAFNAVASVAARLAGQQAALRGLNVQIVRSLAYRLQGMVNQVTSSLDNLERDEQDSARLALLFVADQKVTGARRFVNNLLVIAGGRPQQSVDRPIPVPDVVKAAIGMAEGAATRAQDTKVAADCLIVPEAVDVIVHIVAELLANALYFSPPDTAVTVSSARVGDLLYLHITDEGVGLPAEKLAELEQNLAAFDLAAAARHMGVPVIGLLAADLGLRVTFRPRTGGGTSVEIVIPAHLLVDVPQHSVPLMVGEPAPRRAPSQRQLSPAPALPSPGLTEKTRELWPVAGGPPPGVEPETLRIYDAVIHDNPYFRSGPEEPGPTLPEAWRAGNDAADGVQLATTALAAGLDRATASGLPVRRPGQFAIPIAAPAAPATIPAQRNRAATRRGMAALSRTAARASRSASPTPPQIG